MTDFGKAGTFTLDDRAVKRIGYGAMQLAGPSVFGLIPSTSSVAHLKANLAVADPVLPDDALATLDAIGR